MNETLICKIAGVVLALVGFPFLIYFTMKIARYGWLAGGKQFVRDEFKRLKRKEDK